MTFPAIARHTQNLAKVTIQGTREKNRTLKDIYFKISTGFYKTANTSTTEDGNNILINHFLNHVSTRQRVIADYHVKRNLQACEINLSALFVGGHALGTKVKSPTGEDRTYYIPVTGRAFYPLNTPKQLSSMSVITVYSDAYYFLVFPLFLN